MFRELAEVIHIEEGRFANYDFQTWLSLSELYADEPEDHADWIQAVNFRLQAPRVIRLLEYERIPRQSVRFSRRNVFARDSHCCMYCGRRFPPSQLSLDHVVPRSQGGGTHWENVVSSCVDCNIKKGGRTPQQARMKLVKHPVRPKQSPLLHLKLSNPKYESWRVFVANGAAVDVA